MLQLFRRAALPTQEFLEHRKKKKWLEKGAKKYCLFIYPRSLYVTWGHVPDNWDWKCFKETSEENIEVAKLVRVCWLDVQGALPLSELSDGAIYEVAYVIKLTKAASGWELPLEVTLSVPGEEVPRKRKVTLLDKPRGEWFEVSLGSFTVKNDVVQNGDVRFYLCEHGGHWKTGLIVKGVLFRPAQEEPGPKRDGCSGCGCLNLKAEPTKAIK